MDHNKENRELSSEELQKVSGGDGQRNCAMYYVDPEQCVCCAACENECPAGCIHISGYAVIDQERCILCGMCENACPVSAIYLR